MRDSENSKISSALGVDSDMTGDSLMKIPMMSRGMSVRRVMHVTSIASQSNTSRIASTKHSHANPSRKKDSPRFLPFYLLHHLSSACSTSRNPPPFFPSLRRYPPLEMFYAHSFSALPPSIRQDGTAARTKYQGGEDMKPRRMCFLSSTLSHIL